MREQETVGKYEDILRGFLRKRDEKSLYQAQQFSRGLQKQKTSPEEIISMHYEVLQKMYPNLSEEIRNSFDFLLEVMMGYGIAYREHQSLKDQQLELQSEIAVASNVQETLLKTEIPQNDILDIGAISVPARQMSGDYYHFVDDSNCLGVSIADVIGKGIPAALCMSMIKYSMDSLPETRMQPGKVLENLNRVVEQNVDESMFITMFYGLYDTRNSRFFYSSAGHEPGFYYHAEQNQFTELAAKGLVLGVSRKTKYQEYNIDVKVGDMIILLSDGVTECRSGEEFIDRNKVVDLIQQIIHLSAQEIVENVYQELQKLQDFELRDDFTLIILKRRV